jgi:hypothetical protein
MRKGEPPSSGRKASQVNNFNKIQQADISCCLLGLNFYPEDGGGPPLRNVDEQASDYECHICRLIGDQWSLNFVKGNGCGRIENSYGVLPVLSRSMDKEYAESVFRVTEANYEGRQSGCRLSGAYNNCLQVSPVICLDCILQ